MSIEKVYETYKRLDEKLIKGDFSKEFGKQLVKEMWQAIKKTVKEEN